MLQNIKSFCTGCSACVSVCPKNCISMKPNNEGFIYPRINETFCINCGLCEKTCPCLKPTNTKEKEITSYAIKNKNLNILFKSSSGGVFYEIAKEVLNNNGIVFGAAFANDFKVQHVFVDNIKNLWRLQGSKYVQSEINDCYLTAEKFLKKGVLVFFTGTPCQIEGLLSFLNKNYENLITADFICHGTPSPKAWEIYLSNLKTKFKSDIKTINFRNKDNGWKNYSFSIDFLNNTNLKQPYTENPYMIAFLSDYSLRNSCYICKFKNYNRIADFTLADAWGIEQIMPNMYDYNGTSYVILHSNKATRFFNKIQHNFYYATISHFEINNFNKMYTSSVTKPKVRKLFFKKLTPNVDFLRLQKRCSKPSFSIKIKRIIKRILKTRR